jgi:hypothetical protein
LRNARKRRGRDILGVAVVGESVENTTEETGKELVVVVVDQVALESLKKGRFVVSFRSYRRVFASRLRKTTMC